MEKKYSEFPLKYLVCNWNFLYKKIIYIDVTLYDSLYINKVLTVWDLEELQNIFVKISNTIL